MSSFNSAAEEISKKESSSQFRTENKSQIRKSLDICTSCMNSGLIPTPNVPVIMFQKLFMLQKNHDSYETEMRFKSMHAF